MGTTEGPHVTLPPPLPRHTPPLHLQHTSLLLTSLYLLQHLPVYCYHPPPPQKTTRFVLLSPATCNTYQRVTTSRHLQLACATLPTHIIIVPVIYNQLTHPQIGTKIKTIPPPHIVNYISGLLCKK